MSKIAVVCTAKTEPLAGRIVDDLKGSYYSKNVVSVLFPDRRSGTGGEVPLTLEAMAAGGLLGGTLGWLVGVGALALPGAGAFIAAGPLMSALGGAAMGGAVGGVSGALVGLGFADHQAKYYESKVKSGKVLISVHTKDAQEAQFAKEIFKQQGAEDISSTDEMVAPNDTLTERRRTSVTRTRFSFW